MSFVHQQLMHSNRTAFKLLLAGLLALGLASCGQNAKFSLSFDIPAPVIESLPIQIATYYPPELKEHVYEEDLENYGEFKIDMTGSHQVLFDTVFGSLFENTVEIANFSELPKEMHGFITPKVQDFQITIPQQTRSVYFEVWIQYELALFDSEGQLVHKWPLTAYGKANKENYPSLTRTSELALHDAAESAMRDAAASMSFFFMRDPTIQGWVEQITEGES